VTPDCKDDSFAKALFLPALSYRSNYDGTLFLRESITAVLCHTLFEAMRSSVLVRDPLPADGGPRGPSIPLIAVPVSLGRQRSPVLLYRYGFSINTP